MTHKGNGRSGEQPIGNWDPVWRVAIASTLAFLFGNKGVGGTCGWVRFRGEGLKGAEAVQPDSEF